MSSKRILIDVREPFEYRADHVDGALNIPPSELLSGAKQLANVDRDTELIVYCRTGNRSSAAIQLLKQMGFTNLINGINSGHVVKNYINI